jgi:hypothetical protein
MAVVAVVKVALLLLVVLVALEVEVTVAAVVVVEHLPQQTQAVVLGEGHIQEALA